MLCLHKSQEVNLKTYKLDLAEIATIAVTVVYFPTLYQTWTLRISCCGKLLTFLLLRALLHSRLPKFAEVMRQPSKMEEACALIYFGFVFCFIF